MAFGSAGAVGSGIGIPGGVDVSTAGSTIGPSGKGVGASGIEGGAASATGAGLVGASTAGWGGAAGAAWARTGLDFRVRILRFSRYVSASPARPAAWACLAADS